MKIWIILISIFTYEFHPFNIGVTEIHLNIDDNALQITNRFFVDDLQDEVSAFYQTKVDLMDTVRTEFIDSVMPFYMKYHFNLYVNDEEVEIFYLGHEYHDDTMVMYFEIYNVGKVKTLTVYNNALMNTFEEQTNLIHIYGKQDKFLKTLKLTREKTDDEFEFPDD